MNQYTAIHLLAGDYVNFVTISIWDEMFTIVLAMVVFCSTIKFIKMLKFNARMSMLGDTIRILNEAQQAGFTCLLNEQTRFWKDYWDIADIEIEGNTADQQAVRFNLFQLRQSNPEDNFRSIGANGQTGDAYWGGVFWDTEMFMLPHFLYTQPETVRPLLMYRYNILDKASSCFRE